MCGIFGFTIRRESLDDDDFIVKAANELFQLSESRGKEASGVALLNKDKITILKRPMSASALIRSEEYKTLFKEPFRATSNNSDNNIVVMGHSRLVTNGVQGISNNNQPVVKDGIVGIHNGIVVNDDDVWKNNPSIERHYQVDTEVILSLVRKFINEGSSVIDAVRKTYDVIEGNTTISLLFNDSKSMVIATNSGSLYVCINEEKNMCVFASEKQILVRFVKKKNFQKIFKLSDIYQVKPGEGNLIYIDSLVIKKFLLKDKDVHEDENSRASFNIIDLAAEDERLRDNMRRCTKCILPETMPFIKFDDDGVCNYCHEYAKTDYKGEEALKELAAKYRRNDGRPDCLVTISGGRDSTYGLHYVKKVLGLNPIGFTYDWGMVEDLARRNLSRICGKLGVEHIIISADIKKKRKNIQKNIKAWLKKPNLAMIPLFTAGDKQFFYYANLLSKQNDIPLIFFFSNDLEKTNFKTGFSGVNEGTGRLYDLPVANKVKLTLYYAKQFLVNPAYFNESIFDTMFAYFSSYFIKHNYLFLFNYIGWHEEEIMKTLREEYDWEDAKDTKSTWRIGDGTAAFYNYIYYTVAGFTEFDTFRSNQIREGLMTREEAIKMIKENNKPRYDSMQEYAHRVGFDLDEALFVINSIPKLYNLTSKK